MFDKIFGKKNSLKRIMVRNLVIAVISVTCISLALFFSLVEASVNLKLVEITISSKEEIREILNLIRFNTVFSITITILMSIILTSVSLKKIIKPINQLNEATKKIASGDFDVELETEREDEIGKLTNNFNMMAKELKTNENFQREFINNVSHEIKTPFSSIEGFAKLLKDKNLTDEEREEYADIIIEESERVTSISTKMLKLSKLQNQTLITNKTEIDISEQIRKCVAVLEPKWREKDLKINVSLKDEIFLGDEDLIFQVWMNIIENAIKFSKMNGAIDIKVNSDDKDIIVKIRDYGIGMDEAEKEKIFDRFYQIDKSHSQNGAGLGLSIVKRIIELSEGKITVESVKDKGSVFEIRLPKMKDETNKIIIE